MDDDDWCMDTSAKAVEEREKQAQESFEKIEAATQEVSISEASPKEKKEKKKKKKAQEEDEFGDSAEREAEREGICNKVEAAMELSADGKTDAAIKGLMAAAKEHSLEPLDLFGFIFETVFDETVKAQLATHSKLLGKLYKAAPDKEKTQKFLISCVEKLIGEYDVLMKKTGVILKALYDMDLLEEENIIKWHEKGSKKKQGKAVREAAAPFVTWLQEAEESSDEESSDE